MFQSSRPPIRREPSKRDRVESRREPAFYVSSLKPSLTAVCCTTAFIKITWTNPNIIMSATSSPAKPEAEKPTIDKPREHTEGDEGNDEVRTANGGS